MAGFLSCRSCGDPCDWLDDHARGDGLEFKNSESVCRWNVGENHVLVDSGMGHRGRSGKRESGSKLRGGMQSSEPIRHFPGLGLVETGLEMGIEG